MEICCIAFSIVFFFWLLVIILVLEISLITFHDLGLLVALHFFVIFRQIGAFLQDFVCALLCSVVTVLFFHLIPLPFLQKKISTWCNKCLITWSVAKSSFDTISKGIIGTPLGAPCIFTFWIFTWLVYTNEKRVAVSNLNILCLSMSQIITVNLKENANSCLAPLKFILYVVLGSSHHLCGYFTSTNMFLVMRACKLSFCL